MITTRTTLPFNPRYDSKTCHDALACGADDWEINWRNYNDGQSFLISKSSVSARWFGTCRPRGLNGKCMGTLTTPTL